MMPRAVRQRQRRADRRHDPLHVLHGQPAALRQFLLQAGPAEQLHHQERALRVVGVVVEDRDDVRMAQLRTGAALADEALERRGTLHIREDHLDRDVVAEKDPPRAIHRAHAALGERREDLVAAVEDLPDRKHGLILSACTTG